MKHILIAFVLMCAIKVSGQIPCLYTDSVRIFYFLQDTSAKGRQQSNDSFRLERRYCNDGVFIVDKLSFYYHGRLIAKVDTFIRHENDWQVLRGQEWVTYIDRKWFADPAAVWNFKYGDYCFEYTPFAVYYGPEGERMVFWESFCNQADDFNVKYYFSMQDGITRFERCGRKLTYFRVPAPDW